MADWYIGQKIVCINDKLDPGEPGPYLVLNRIYPITGFEEWYGEIAFILEGMHPCSKEAWYAQWEDDMLTWCYGYDPKCFRPVEEDKKKTDISAFKEILNVKSKELELV